MNKIERHKALCDELNKLYTKKNHDYGDAFHLSYLEEGMAMPRIRLGDKLNRFKTLSKNPDQAKVGESLKDTLIDLANYAIMTVLEMEEKNKKANKLFKYDGEFVRLECDEDGKWDIDSPHCSTCEVCTYSWVAPNSSPCADCRHNAGEVERFTFDLNKTEGVEYED